MKKKLKSVKYVHCQQCGRAISPVFVGAEKYTWFEGCHPHRKFDQDSGERQYVKKYKCIKAHFWNCHDNFMREEIYT